MTAPLNDNFADAINIVFGDADSAYVSALVDNSEATSESGEPAAVTNSNVKSCWWKVTPDVTGPVYVDTNLSSPFGADTQIGVYTGSAVSALTVVAGDQDSGPLNASALTFTATAGTTYYIQVGAYQGAAMSYRLRVVRRPPNDNFADAFPVALATTGATYTSPDVANFLGTTETDEVNPFGWGGGYGKTAWWTYTPATSGTATFDTSTTKVNGTVGGDTGLVVYTGSSLNALTVAAQDDDSGAGSLSQVTSMPVVAGTTYRIQVMSFAAANMTYALRVSGPATSGGAGGTFDVTFPAFTTDLAGPMDSLDATFPAFSVSGFGEVTRLATIDASFPAFTVTAAGAVADVTTGALDAAFPAFSVGLVGDIDDSVGTDTDNLANGRRRHAIAYVETDVVVTTRPANLRRGYDFDKAIAYTEPDMDDGRPT